MNEPTKGWLRLTKTDRKNGNPVAGVTFDIYENDAYGDALVGSMTTDENGVAVSRAAAQGHAISSVSMAKQRAMFLKKSRWTRP